MAKLNSDTVNFDGNDGSEFQQKIDELDNIIEEEQSKRKGKQGRKSKKLESAEQAKKVFEISNDVLNPAFNFLNKIIEEIGYKKFGERGKKLMLSENELYSLKQYSAMILNKYLPDTLEKYSPELVLGILTLSIGTEKYYVYQKLKKDKNESDKKTE